MAQLFDLKAGNVVLNPDSLAIPMFSKIWKTDKTKTKEKATKEISYIYFMCDFSSPYMVYPETKRREVIVKDFMKDTKWKESESILHAMKRYKDFSL